MIAHLTGKLTDKDPSEAVVECGGIGYGIFIPVSTFSQLPQVGSEITLHTYQYVREDTLTLYGFTTLSEKRLFSQLLGVSGIGPKVALAILSVSSVADIKNAIATSDTAFISSVPGIGTKTAERVVVDLKDKMGATTAEATSGGSHEVVIEALVGLGYSNKESRRAVHAAAQTASETDDILRHALKELAA